MQLAAPKITAFPHLFVSMYVSLCVPLIMCEIIMSHTLLPCNLTEADREWKCQKQATARDAYRVAN